MHLSTLILFTCISCLLLTGCNGGGEDTQSPISDGSHPAISAITQAIEENPENARFYAERAMVYYEREGYDEAIADFEKALQLDSNNIDYLHLLADAHLDYYQSRKALEVMVKAADLYPKRIPTLLKLSEFQLILKHHEDALKTLNRIFEVDPLNAEAFFMTGMTYKDLEKKEMAIRYLQQAVENDPDLIDAWINLGQLHAELGDPNALQYFNSALEIAPRNVEVMHAKAYYLQETDQLRPAIDLFQEITRIDPQYEDAYFNAGLLYLDMDSFDMAYRQFDLTIKFSPVHVRAYYYRGVSAELMGKSAQARRDYEQALRLNPDYEQARTALSRLSPS